MIEYNSGQMYICQTGKEPYPIGGVKEMIFDGAPHTHCDISPRTLKAIAVLDMCPNEKVMHLILHGRKRRTRVKNFNRAIWILERIAAKEKNDV